MLLALLAIAVAVGFVSNARAERLSDGACGIPAYYEDNAFLEPMRFFRASNKGNMSTATWVAAVGKITQDTPLQFAEFIQSEGIRGGQIFLHSPGGNLAAGLTLGRVMREVGLSTHVGKTILLDLESDFPCRTRANNVEAGGCYSSCAWAFMGDVTRFMPSPYYPTQQSELGFHQFFFPRDQTGKIISGEKASAIRDAALNVGQFLTGETVLYSMDMGVDARAVQFATNTSSGDILRPTPEQLAEYLVTTPEGFGKWFLEPYKTGLVAAARPQLPTSILVQVISFCNSTQTPKLLITMKGFGQFGSSSYDEVIDGVKIHANGNLKYVDSSRLSHRLEGDLMYLTLDLPTSIAKQILSTNELAFRLDVPRAFGYFSEKGSLDEIARKSIALSWRNCI